MPMPESRTRNTTSGPSRFALNQISPPGIGVLGRVHQQIRKDLLQPVGIRFERRFFARRIQMKRVPARRKQNVVGLGDSRDDLGHIHLRLLQLNATARDAGNVEQIIDQPLHQRRLLANDLERFVKSCFARFEQLGQFAGVRDRRQRVSQLVPEHRQELIFPPLAVANGLKELGVVERGRRSAGQVFDQRQIRRLELPPGRSSTQSRPAACRGQ